MGKVGGKNQALVAEVINRVLRRLLVAFDRRVTLPLEVKARGILKLWRPLNAVLFPVFIETPHEKREPTAVAFEKCYA